jgi:hypothetical protein
MDILTHTWLLEGFQIPLQILNTSCLMQKNLHINKIEELNYLTQ